MKKRQLGNSDLWVSEMGLGCMSLSSNRDHAKKIIQTAFEEGINYFDTADLYDYGVNEEIVGKALAPIRDQVIIATKVGNRWNKQKNGWHWDPSKAYIKEAVKNSLKRLQTDYIDLYQLHGGTIDDPSEETIEAFEELRREGLIRYYGISSIRPNVIKSFAEKSAIISNMMQYSILDRRPEELFAFLQDKNISVVTRGSVAKGLLSDKVLEKLNSEELEGYLNYTSVEVKELIKSIQAKLLTTGRTLNEIALQYNLAHKAVAAVVTGASSVEQVKDNARAVNTEPLHQEEIEYLKWITKETRYENHR
ncbi:aldo/keto reductase [Lederbergia galactosidilytica]|uniref:Oxidoreductase n=1 Tax=Lederbergia galactosidilytica TaxID=217031 RepID=A0A178A5A2_9BACI|nr:aldo/keto reductase [Lederbergia galactosidilytica]KRG08691.1 oxidoreductase [Virgibacillus soli]MBP1914700.1 aryl-alcohol dehydrogenase-like predicted oxidoreductase [Lederbergia galactosidilytica]OAK75281.1 oxidoreductase [Lederbergia galactosidilytica]